jgi:UPF0716 protein FxsA
MRLGLLLVFAAIPFLEIALMIKVGQALGFWPTLAMIVASAVLGTYVLYEQGFQVLGRAMDAMARGKPPVGPVVDGVFVALAGLLLIVPGFLTDIFGLALLIPRARHAVAAWSIRRVLRSAEMRGFVFGTRTTNGTGNGNGSGAHAGQPGQASHDAGGPRSAAGASRPPAGNGPIIEGEVLSVGERTVDPRRGSSQRGQG